MRKIDFIALQAASKVFATESLPDNWLELTDEQQCKWIKEHSLAPFKNDSPDSVFALIEMHSETIKATIKQALEILKGKMVNAAIQCEFPSDINELDLQTMLELE